MLTSILLYFFGFLFLCFEFDLFYLLGVLRMVVFEQASSKTPTVWLLMHSLFAFWAKALFLFVQNSSFTLLYFLFFRSLSFQWHHPVLSPDYVSRSIPVVWFLQYSWSGDIIVFLYTFKRNTVCIFGANCHKRLNGMCVLMWYIKPCQQDFSNWSVKSSGITK